MVNWDAARWRVVSAEIDRILDLPVEARQAALDALRARDAALAADVARLLAEQPAVEAGGFLEGGAASALPTFSSTSEDGVAVPRPPVMLPAGATFGGYRIRRMLGRGGMGIVYEAEEIESGRRVALKILQGRFDDERERERFEREGQLAASIDHEHCVFVFGASEVDGTPSIAMELMHGTLADRLAAHGPLPPAAAVDAALQLVAGLQAAQAAGILHRDVKPSNCFVDADGVVKIGDFGISRSTRPTQETTRATRGLVAATPAYAPPEQLRGAPLDARSDIYSLGATLYELLTSERPFTAADLMSLLMTVANDPARPPHVLSPTVPKGLSRVVLRCLAKKPDDRFQTYDALAAALEPYASWSPTPATLGRRLLAGVVDHLTLGTVSLPITFTLAASFGPIFDARAMAWQTAASMTLALLYYGISEGRWGATVGKALAGLRLVDTAAQPPRMTAAFARVGLFLTPGLVLGAVSLAYTAEMQQLLRTSPLAGAGLSLVPSAAILALLFSTARRRNGYAGLHDLGSRTRVVARDARAARSVLRLKDDRPPDARRVQWGTAGGGFVTLPDVIEGRPGWRTGHDPRLGRPVWIREGDVDTPPVAPARAAIARPTRLRWLAGRRTAHDGWDVYEAVAGRPLARVLDEAPGWAAARQWLADLAHELAAQGPGDRPPLTTDRVWILESGRAKLLDDPTVDVPGASDEAAASAFLGEVARRIREGAHGPWPVSAERLLRELPSTSVAQIATRLDLLQQGRAAMTRGWRLVTLTACTVPALFMTMLVIAGIAFMTAQVRRTPPDLRVVISGLRALRDDAVAVREAKPPDDRRRLGSGEREAVELFLASRHRVTLADARLFDPMTFFAATDEDKAIAARLLRHPPIAPEAADVAAANPRVRTLVERAHDPEMPPPWVVGLLMFFGTLTVTAVVAVLLAAAVRGVMVRLLGFEIVTADGTPASRLRTTWRAIVTWSPIAAAIAVSSLTNALKTPAHVNLLFGLTLLVLLAGAVAAALDPTRGIQDRLAGTWIVPR